MAQNFPGSILHGGANVPIHGRDGKILCSAMPYRTAAVIVVDWAEDDVDICAFWVGHGGEVGYHHENQTEANGYGQLWESRDNTSGGPERVVAGYAGAHFPEGSAWEVHLNWYRGGPGAAEVTIKPPVGRPITVTAEVANNDAHSATGSDPGVRVIFNRDNSIKEVILI